MKTYKRPFFIFVAFIIYFLSTLTSSAQIPSLQFSRFYNGPGANLSDVAQAVAQDNNNNVYVTGWSYRNYSTKSIDIVTIKYNAAGIQQWVARYNGALDTTEFPCAIDLDPYGNVYVLGKTATPSGNKIIVIKYNSGGTQLWTATYNGGYSDAAYSPRWIKADNYGNVVITTNIFTTSHDFLTIKYDSSGQKLWQATYDAANNGDIPSALTLDANGNIFVTGMSINASGNSDYATIKYSPSGTQLWIARYNGPVNGGDEAKDITIDNAGYVYVTGRSVNTGIADYDYVTIKYNPLTGDSIWVRKYNFNTDEAYAITVDNSNNVIVTGFSNSHVTTIKYNSSGTQLWAISYNGGGPWDYGRQIKCSSSGDVYVGGWSYSGSSLRDENYLLVKYNSAGVFQWAQTYNGPGNDRDELISMSISTTGEPVVTGFSYAGQFSGVTDYATIKYNSNGTQLWANRYNAPVSSLDICKDFSLDFNGNLILTGQSDGGVTVGDILTVKFTPSGDTLWTRRFNGSANSIDEPAAITVDQFNNIYVTGYSWEGYNVNSSAMITLKYNSTGGLQWVSTFHPVSFPMTGVSVAADNAGNVYATGIYRFATGSWPVDIVTIKYNPTNGDTLWTRYYDGGSLDEPKKIVVDSSGFIYVLGKSNRGSNNLDYLIIKYNSSGDTIWTTNYNGPANQWDEPNDLCVDASGNVYVTGFSRSGSAYGTEDVLTTKFNSNGVLLWSNRFNGSGNYFDAGYSITTANGYVYVGGVTYRTVTKYDFLVIKYNATNGDTVWTKVYDGGTNGTDFANSVTATSNGQVYATGALNTNGNYQLGIRGFGTQEWSTVYFANRPDSGYSNSKIIVSGQNLYVASSTFENNNYDYLLLKYSLTTDIKTISSNVPTAFRLQQNYPNPFNAVTKIQFDIPKTGFVTLKVFDILGREIKVLLEEEKLAGSYELLFDAANLPSGVYIYEITASEFRDSKKLVVIK